MFHDLTNTLSNENARALRKASNLSKSEPSMHANPHMSTAYTFAMCMELPSRFRTRRGGSAQMAACVCGGLPSMHHRFIANNKNMFSETAQVAADGGGRRPAHHRHELRGMQLRGLFVVSFFICFVLACLPRPLGTFAGQQQSAHGGSQSRHAAPTVRPYQALTGIVPHVHHTRCIRPLRAPAPFPKFHVVLNNAVCTAYALHLFVC